MALLGRVWAAGMTSNPHIITSVVEHPAILAPATSWNDRAWRSTTFP